MSKANLFLLAAPRSGSTQFAAWLSSHASIGCTFIKEPNFFSQHEFPVSYVTKEHLNDIDPERIGDTAKLKGKSFQFSIFRRSEDYQVLIDELSSQYKMDASTTYLHCPEAAKKTLEYNPDAKYILLLREPIARLESHYRLAIRTGRESRSFKERLALENAGKELLCSSYLFRQSLYYSAVKKYVELVPPENLKVVLFEDLMGNKELVMNEIAEFLSISEEGFSFSSSERNEGVAPRFPWVNRFIAKTGIKTHLRAVLSKSMKNKLKKLYFSDKKIYVDMQELVPYLPRFIEDREKLSKILPSLGEKWVNPNTKVRGK
jgi:hypothetical protein